jgi:hypothetical protein
LIPLTRPIPVASVGSRRPLSCASDVFRDVYKRGNERGKAAVRIAQFKKALSGDSLMLIYQGKQRLGQSERREIGVVAMGGDGDMQRPAERETEARLGGPCLRPGWIYPWF